ncbi:hypothetical protein NK356_11515 [Chryseobacterium sp. S0630]|uniref:hypothetical protein n=1 Tax=Chryseobacterium sp. S0630 TaxID=2957803 RepID=UPI0020A19879|nr:hypothetical protein [Chryseobacterium sp. S0630]MCP1299796.1 hypothetical protein [Chryseobacterium sp. S0630]
MNYKWLKLSLFLLIIVYLFRENVVYIPILNTFSKEYTKGYIINEKYYKRRGQFTNLFTYYYKFSTGGKDYSNPSYDEKYKVGDSVLVEYNKTFPFMNRIKNQK